MGFNLKPANAKKLALYKNTLKVQIKFKSRL